MTFQEIVGLNVAWCLSVGVPEGDLRTEFRETVWNAVLGEVEQGGSSRCVDVASVCGTGVGD